MQDTTLQLVLLDLAFVLGLCNVPLWFGAIAAGVFRYLRNRRDARHEWVESQLRADVRSLQQNIQAARDAARERERVAEMAAHKRQRYEDARAAVLALLHVQSVERTMSHQAATRHGMTRPQWERACSLLVSAKVGMRDGRGTVRLVCPEWDARERTLAYLESLPDEVGYVMP